MSDENETPICQRNKEIIERVREIEKLIYPLAKENPTLTLMALMDMGKMARDALYEAVEQEKAMAALQSMFESVKKLHDEEEKHDCAMH